VVVAGVGALFEAAWVDPVAGIVVAGAMGWLLARTARRMSRRLLDGVEPVIVDEVEETVRDVEGVRDITDLRVRWHGHRLNVAVSISVDPDLTVEVGHDTAHEVEHASITDSRSPSRRSSTSNRTDGPPPTTPRRTTCDRSPTSDLPCGVAGNNRGQSKAGWYDAAHPGAHRRRGEQLTVDFEVLGTLRVLEDGDEVTISRPAQQRVLSILLLRADGEIEKNELIELMWGDHAPPTAGNTLHAHIAGLRKILGREAIRTTERGYRLGIANQPADVGRFDALCNDVGRLLQSRPYEALGSAEEALELWRGRPYVVIEYDEFALAEIRRLEERHAAVVELRFEAYAAVGRLTSCIPDLEKATRMWPLRERLRELQMLALYQAGRQADALRVFLDCDRGCDFDYLRQEITFVNYVRDRRDAQVHVLITRERTAAGGQA